MQALHFKNHIASPSLSSVFFFSESFFEPILLWLALNTGNVIGLFFKCFLCVISVWGNMHVCVSCKAHNLSCKALCFTVLFISLPHLTQRLLQRRCGRVLLTWPQMQQLHVSSTELVCQGHAHSTGALSFVIPQGQNLFYMTFPCWLKCLIVLPFIAMTMTSKDVTYYV